MAATFHFLSLKCIKQQEVGDDEIRILIGGKQVFPALPEKYIKMRKGDSWVNGEAPIDQPLLEDLLLPDKAMDISGYYQVEALTEAPISATGAVIQVIEVDEPWTKNDVIGKLLVSDVPTSTVQTRMLTGAGAKYEIQWIVTSNEDAIPEAEAKTNPTPAPWENE